MGAGQGKLRQVDHREVGQQVGARIGQRAGQPARALARAGNFQRSDVERSLGAPPELQRQGAVIADQPGRRQGAGRTGQIRVGQLDTARAPGSLAFQRRRVAEQMIDLAPAAGEALGLGVEAKQPRVPSALGRAPARGHQALPARMGDSEVREAGLALERQAAKDAALAVRIHLEPRPDHGQRLDQHVAVRQPDQLGRGVRPATQQRGDDAAPRAAGSVHGRDDVELAAAPVERHRTTRLRQLIVEGGGVVGLEHTRQHPTVGAAGKRSGHPGRAHLRETEEALTLARQDRHLQAFRPDRLAVEIGLAASADVDVFRRRLQRDVLQSVGGAHAGDLEAQIRAQPVLVPGEILRRRQHDLAAALPALRRPGAVGGDRDQRPAAAVDVEAALAGRAGRGRRDQERLIGGQAQRAGQRAAAGLARPQIEADGLVAAKIEVDVDAVAGVGKADDDGAPRHPAFAAAVEGASDVVEPVAGAERRQQFQPCGELADVQRDRGPAGRRCGRFRFRLP